ncbi:hypothetical protein V6N12_022911 [Hibiscus sabdariffa]|uniref:Uncharacterized protein n=1 Tax=Hibiscus sabdariffa TaxID=183260 RepID=A0ABR2FW95_9ROSI
MPTKTIACFFVLNSAGFKNNPRVAREFDPVPARDREQRKARFLAKTNKPIKVMMIMKKKKKKKMGSLLPTKKERRLPKDQGENPCGLLTRGIMDCQG